MKAVVVGPGKPGVLKVSLGVGDGQFVSDVPSELVPPPLRLPNSQFVAVVKGRDIIRVEPDGRAWLTIQERIRAVLNSDWDPIGVASKIDDEYDEYIGPIYSLLAANSSAQAIADCLLLIETEHMSLPGTQMDKLLQIAMKLRELQLPSVRISQ